MIRLRTLLLPLLALAALRAADNPLVTAMAGGTQAWDYGDLVWFVNDAWDAPGALNYVWRLRDALLQARPELDMKVEVTGFGDARALAELLGSTVAGREPAVVVVCTGNAAAAAASKPENAPTPDQFAKQLGDGLAALRAAHCEVVLLGPSPVSDNPEGKTPQDELSAKYADIAASAAKVADAAYIDMRAACIAYLKANPPAAGKAVLTPGESRFTNAWHDLAAPLVAKAIGERMAAAPMRIDIEDSPFVDTMLVSLPLKRVRKGAEVEIRYTLDGKDPAKSGRKYDKPFAVSGASTTVTVLATDKGNNLTATAKAVFTRVKAKPGEAVSRRGLGLEWGFYQGRWAGSLPDFTSLKPDATGVWNAPELAAYHQNASYGTVRENVGMRFVGYIDIPVEGTYLFAVASDDGSRMWIDDELVVDNDGFHGMRERHGRIALREGLHPVRIDWINGSGGSGLEVSWQSDAGVRRAKVPDSAWCRNLAKPHDWKPVEKPVPAPAPKK